MSQCKGCGREIIWAETPEGKKIPLDSVAPIYYLLSNESMPHCERLLNTYVSHFSTCPKANDFSRSNKTK